MNLTIGCRCFERDRGGDAVPRGGIVIAVLPLSDEVVVALRYGRRTIDKQANVPYVKTAVLRQTDVDPATIEEVSTAERVKLARVIAGAVGVRQARDYTAEDARDLATVGALMAPYAAGIDEPVRVTMSGGQGGSGVSGGGGVAGGGA